MEGFSHPLKHQVHYAYEVKKSTGHPTLCPWALLMSGNRTVERWGEVCQQHPLVSPARGLSGQGDSMQLPRSLW